MNAASDRLSDGDLPIALDPLQLEPGDEHEDSDREPAHRCRAVEIVLDRDQPSVRVGQPSDRSQRVDRGAGKPVQARNNDPTRLTALAAGKRLLEHRPLKLCARLVDLVPPLNDLDPCSFAQASIFCRCTSGDGRLCLDWRAAQTQNVAVRRLYSAHVLGDQLDVRKHSDEYRIELIDRSGK